MAAGTPLLEAVLDGVGLRRMCWLGMRVLALSSSICSSAPARARCLLLGRKDPCCIHYRGLAAVSCFGRSGLGFLFSLQDPIGEAGVLAGLAPKLG